MTYIKLTASQDAALSGKYRIVGARLIGGSDTTTVTFYDNTLQSGNDFLTMKAAAGAIDNFNPRNNAEMTLSKGLSVTLDQGSGTGAILYIYYV